MPNIIGYYREELERQQTTVNKTILDEIEGEIKRLKDYVEHIDLDSKEELQDGIDYIKASLKELAEKLY